MSILISFLLAVFGVVCALLVFVILMQRPKSEGLGAAFGASVTENIFGAQTTTVLVKITGWLAGIFFVLAFALAVLYAHKSTGQSALRRELARTPALPAPSAAKVSPSPAGAKEAPPPAAKASPASSSSPTATP